MHIHTHSYFKNFFIQSLSFLHMVVQQLFMGSLTFKLLPLMMKVRSRTCVAFRNFVVQLVVAGGVLTLSSTSHLEVKH